MRARAIDQPDAAGVVVDDLDLATASDEDLELLRKHVYVDKFVALKHQDLTPDELVEFGHRIGTLVPYHEDMYHHPDHPEIFVSSNVVEEDGRHVGVPKTGRFWHTDYQFMPEPFAFSILCPQVLPKESRGTYYVNMVEAYESLPPGQRDDLLGRTARHSVRRYFKIRPDDAYRPLGDLLDEVERRTPPVTFPLVIEHPVTGEKVLYLSEGFTYEVSGGNSELLHQLLVASGQLDPSFSHSLIRRYQYEPGDLVIWDNRCLIHRALHAPTPDPAVSFRLTALDEHPLSARAVSA
jgi:alpha-ketoglutarate-dependent taurine dioxygenase